MLHTFHSSQQEGSEVLSDTVLQELSRLVASLDNELPHTFATLTVEAPLLVDSPRKTEQEPAKVIDIFIAYAERDEDLLTELQEHLLVMKRQYAEREHYQIRIWHSGKTLPGQDWKRSVEHHLVRAHIILLLVSVKFLSSEFCYSIQIQPALDRHNASEACVIPVILRPCDWRHEAFGHLQPLPIRGRSVAKWKPRDDAYVNIVIGIRKAIDHLLYPNDCNKSL